jgi:hypothetical protein
MSATEYLGVRTTMMHTKFLTAALAVAATLSFAGPSQAITVTNLAVFNTGVDASGNPLPGGAIDPHYTLIQSPDVTWDGPEAFVTNNGFPIGPWAANSSVSKWISPRADAGSSNTPGQYTYRTTLDLTGFDPTTAVIIGRWMSDNNGLDIRVNGNGTGNTTLFDSFTRGFANFTLDDYFVSGINTIDFVVMNGSAFVNPTGLRVEMTGTALPVPEPGTWAMVAIGLGLVGLGTSRRQRRRIGS